MDAKAKEMIDSIMVDLNTALDNLEAEKIARAKLQGENDALYAVIRKLRSRRWMDSDKFLTPSAN